MTKACDWLPWMFTPSASTQNPPTMVSRRFDYRLLEQGKTHPDDAALCRNKRSIHFHALLLYRVGRFLWSFFSRCLYGFERWNSFLTSINGGIEIGEGAVWSSHHTATDIIALCWWKKGYAIAICDPSRGMRLLLLPKIVRYGSNASSYTWYIAGWRDAEGASNNFGGCSAEIFGVLAYADISGEFVTTRASNLGIWRKLMRLQPSGTCSCTEFGGLLRPGRHQTFASCFRHHFATASQTPLHRQKRRIDYATV